MMIRRAIAEIGYMLLLVSVLGYTASAQKTIPLYPNGNIPNSVPGPDEEYIGKGMDHEAMNVSRPTLTVYLPPKSKATGAAVIICPGGGYGSLVVDREGKRVAKAFSEMGIAAFVLKYRLPSSKTMKDRTIGPLQDAQQAIKYVRQTAKENNVLPDRIGILGFSAGGHLAATAGVRYEPALIPDKDDVNLRPDFMILLYPVITMDTVVGHKGSTLNLLGSAPTAEQMNYFSDELHVTKNTPPAFIAVAGDNHLLSNSLLFYNALHENGVEAELHVYAKGGHDFLKYPSFDEWAGRCFNWMKLNHWLDKTLHE